MVLWVGISILIQSWLPSQALAAGVPQVVDSSKLSFARLTEAVQLLMNSQRGKLLLQQGTTRQIITEILKGNGKSSLFKWGNSSRTDTTLTRQFNPKTGREERFRKQVIFLNPDQNSLELALDLAHELVHASSKPIYDPYDPSLTPAKYIQLSIEGFGGEVDAVYTECEIAVELTKKNHTLLDRCRRFLNTGPLSGSIDRLKIVRGFYRIGNWKKDLSKNLGPEIASFPNITAEKPVLFSSTGHTPYPVALYDEYEEITRAACENSVKRQASLMSTQSASSSNESVHSSQSDRVGRSEGLLSNSAAENFLKFRCSH